MFFKCYVWKLSAFIVSLLYLHSVAGFFVKHVKTGMCIYDTAQIQSQGSGAGNLSFLELSNNCLDPAAQFRFRDNGAMLNLKRRGCLAAFVNSFSGHYLHMFYLFVPAASVSLDNSSCAQDPGRKIYRRITQTSWGGLSVYYKGRFVHSVFQNWCAVPRTLTPLVQSYRIDSFIGLEYNCNYAEDRRFNFGSVTCYGKTTENVTCPKDQFMVVNTASYRGLSDSKTCGLSDDYSCTVDVTCLVKKQCDGQHECKITVDKTLFSDDLCPGLKKYLYFEYRCFNDVKIYNDVCVRGVSLSLSNSSLPNEGIVRITANNWTKSVCAGSLNDKAKNIVCAHMGYKRAESVVNTPVLPDSKIEIFSGTINCNHDDNDLSFCSLTISTSSCSQLSYIKCHICDSPLLEDKERFPDSSFTASVSSEGYRASDARISSGSSWCAPVSDDKHYLQVDFKRLYSINYVATFGDGTSAKWVKTYILNYTTDLINWKQSHAVFQKIFRGNQNAFNGAAIRNLNGLTTRALRFIPLSYEVQPCMRIEICGQRAAGFFVKHVKTGMCVIDTGFEKHSSPLWGSLSFLELSNNSCFDEAAQFRFRDNGAMFNIKRKGCLAAYFKVDFGPYFDVLYLYVPATSLALDYSACVQDPVKKIYRRITQTSWGGLSVYYKGYTKTTFQNWCAVPKTHTPLAQKEGIDPYIGLTTDCNDTEDKRFNFGSVTCYGKMVGNINCPKDQFMVVKTASYRGLSDSKTCGLSDDYSCTVDVTCLVKKQCDGQHECKITVDKTLFSDDLCPGLRKYLYFEYQCIDTAKSYSVVCAPEGPPLNVKVTAESSSSLSVTWDPPEEEKRNGVIVNYTVCISHEETKPCFKEHTTEKMMLVIDNLNASTKYFVRVLASTKVGPGNYSKSQGMFTNGEGTKMATNRTETTLTFSLQIPSENFTYFYVVALKMRKSTDSLRPSSSHNDLVTYKEAKTSVEPKPYIAAVITSRDKNMFILGDGGNTSSQTTRRRRSTTNDYYNGPLESGASYSIFQRIFLDDKGEFYSTDWSPLSKTETPAPRPTLTTNTGIAESYASWGPSCVIHAVLAE
ncbi:uncharacterized protein LOC114525466 isoform X2 [Dendronephthya gigantea]|uniref:uncharacterized protein LOC114525466 isoform X2 n=1 Tax=Dendronephthya gigantea TaxID=151771 RepID=UPI00106CFD86|nr:uncharacterized protein LOC114525466 isoform X2 [Dendronephthya gigantea]